MKTKQISIKGMHCRSCEILIEEELKKVAGVKEVDVSYKTGVASLHCDCEPDEKGLAKAVELAGYSFGAMEKLPLFSKNQRDYLDLGIAFFIATFLFLIAKKLGIFNLGNMVSSGSYASLSIVFFVGLTAGISTCMALVGGLVLGASASFSARHPEASGLYKFKPHLIFNLGRILSYFLLGGIIGLVGSLFQMSASVLGILTVAVALVMLLLGGQLIDIFPALKQVSFTFPKSLAKILGIQKKWKIEYSNKNIFLMGAGTFFLPCGFTQAMQLYAMSTGSFVTGALTMGVFALGTTPGLLSVGGLTSFMRGSVSRLFFKTSGIVVILLALFNFSNGLNLLGINTKVLGVFSVDKKTNNINDPNVQMVDGVQVVRMTQGSFGYSPNQFTIKKGVPVKWIVTSKDSYTCAASLLSQKLGIRKGLEIGENIFEFMPIEVGTIGFSCSMGMYTGSFRVVEESSKTGVVLADSSTVSDRKVNAFSCGMMRGCAGCGTKKNTNVDLGRTIIQQEMQLLKATYTSQGDISPNKFIVKNNQPVRFDIDAKDDGLGCMGSITIPNLTKNVEVFTKGQTISFEFTPTRPGNYIITCGMGVPRGEILVN